MTYVKWVANADRHNDWTSELLLKDGTKVTMGVPIDLKSDVQKALEEDGRQFVASSKQELDEHMTSEEVIQPPGNDVVGTAPVFVNAGSPAPAPAEAPAAEPEEAKSANSEKK